MSADEERFSAFVNLHSSYHTPLECWLLSDPAGEELVRLMMITQQRQVSVPRTWWCVIYILSPSEAVIIYWRGVGHLEWWNIPCEAGLVLLLQLCAGGQHIPHTLDTNFFTPPRRTKTYHDTRQVFPSAARLICPQPHPSRLYCLKYWRYDVILFYY